jgi:hypothetical protein
MFNRYTRITGVMLLSLIAFCGMASGGDNNNGNKNSNSIKIADQVPNILSMQFKALGNRLKIVGKEKTVYEGELIDAAGNSSSVRITIQSPGLVKLEGFKGSKSVISFDGNQSKGVSNRADESTIETFLMDMAESMLATAGRTAAVRLLARKFWPDPRTEPNYNGPGYDVYEAAMPFVYKKTTAMRPKQFYFDTQTRLLAKTSYFDRSAKPPIKVETRFSVWGTIDGSAYPARIDHYENDALVFSFIATKIEGGPAIDASNFR